MIELVTILFWMQFASASSPREVTMSEKKELEKTPKALFLIKRAKIGSDVGEPQFYPGESQLRAVINDPNLRNLKNFE